MTKEEILAMKPGKKLNIAVAKLVMEHEVIVDEILGDIERPVGEDSSSTWDTLLPYSGDISAAQLVTEKMITLGHNDAVFWDQYGDGIYTRPEAICKRALLVVLGMVDEKVDMGPMPIEKGKRKELLDNIIEFEFDMFERVRTSEPSLCKDQPETFRAMRGITHSVLSTKTLQSYLEDLQKAKAEGRNLLTEKYARMDNRIPPLKTNPIIDDIVEIEDRWMDELSRKYPHTFKRGPGFKIYLSCELETYSDETLKLYFGDVSRAEKKGRNLTEGRYTKLTKQMGYGSIDELKGKGGQGIA